MRKLSNADIDHLLEKMGLHRESDGSVISDGTMTGPKGYAYVGWLEDDEYMTLDEFRAFLCDQLELLEEEVNEVCLDVFGSLH